MASMQDDIDSENTSINITPLVDIMLVLLIIFLVTANMQQKKTIDVNLPKAQTGVLVAQKGEALAFSIDKESKVFLNGLPISPDEIDAKVTELKTAGIKVDVSIAADDAAPHGAVMRLIDKLRHHDIVDFAFDVEEK